MLLIQQELLMNYLSIRTKIEQLDLKWQEYDFGDTMYAKMPANVFSKKTNIVNNCTIQKYTIHFQESGDAFIFKESESAPLLKTMIGILLEINLLLSKQEGNVPQAKNKHLDY